MGMKGKRQTLIFGIIHFILFFIILGFFAFGLDLIPKADKPSEWINSNVNLTFWALLILHIVSFSIYLAYVYCNNVYMDDAVTTNNRSLESAQNRIDKDIKKLETDTEKQRNRQNNMYAESQKHLHFNECQYIEIKHSIQDLVKEVKQIHSELEKEGKNR